MEPEKRVLLAIFLAFVVLYVWQALFVKPVPKPVGPGAPGAARTTPSPATSAAPIAGSPAGPAVAPQPPAAPPLAESPSQNIPGASTLVGATSEQDVRIETQDVVAVFTNRGAVLESWRLKKYKDRAGQPQELVNTAVATQPLPFSLRTDDATETSRLNTALYEVSGTPTSPATETPVNLRFEYRDSSGLHAVKEFRLEPTLYVVTLKTTVNDGDRALNPEIVWGPAIGDTSEHGTYVQKPRGLVLIGDDVQRLDADTIGKQPVYDGDFKYIGVDDAYFMTAVLFAGPQKVSFQPVAIPPPAGSTNPPGEMMSYAVQPRAAGATLKFFVGPKDFDVLAAIDKDMTRAIDFGIFEILVVPLLRSLKWVNRSIGNYGWSIIVLTLILNALMFPLRHKSVVSMRKMQELQPEVKAIQDRYAKLKATDPAKQKMNQELMALYRERGVNPASGCVPILLTMPLLFAMWAMLSTAIELRGAPFILWIHDLTAHDPFYIFPIIMGASQFWQTKITPATGADPAQQKMMLFMPLIFTVMFLWLPAGVAIYYAVTNLWGIGQQYLTNYLIGPPKMRHVRPPAERQMKRVGGGKSDGAS